jgi:hypothetical protein
MWGRKSNLHVLDGNTKNGLPPPADVGEVLSCLRDNADSVFVAGIMQTVFSLPMTKRVYGAMFNGVSEHRRTEAGHTAEAGLTRKFLEAEVALTV